MRVDPADPARELTPEQWERLQSLFVAGCDLPAPEHEAFIAAVDDDDAVRQHLAGMLASDADARTRLARIVEAAAHVAAPRDPWTGRQLGAYRIVREIGHGGMGVVFEAVRDDYQKRVALKIAPWSRDVALIRDRFRLEGQILAALEHPNIARFLDAGTDDDVPFVVMEYVEGVPITEHCAAHDLGIRERLDLFREVCTAVHVAHERLIVHRDLKPANILVDTIGTPKLLDFGIAKLLNPVAPNDVTAGVALWTADYTSPEQARNTPVTVRTDVYSLGLILYELLTGARAQIADSSSPLALDRSICEIDPVRPSDRVEATGDRARSRALRGDLDTIVMTAIRKEPEGRYSSAAALRDDIGRYLEGRPVLARPSSTLYRTRKFMRRHRFGVAASLVLAASAVAGVAATVYQAQRAERRFQQVRSLANAVVFDLHDRIATMPGSTEVRKALVQTALTYLENLQADAGGDDGLSTELAAAYEKVARVQGNPLAPNLGDMRGALASYTRAADLLAPLARKRHMGARLRLASVSHERGLVHLALGDVNAARAAFDRSRALGEAMLAAEPNNAAALALMGSVFAALTQLAGDLRDVASSVAASERAVTMARRLVELHPKSLPHRHNLASAHTTRARVASVAGRTEEAIAQYRLAIDIREQLVREDPAALTYRRNLLVGYGNLGDLLGARRGQNVGDTRGAEEAFARAAEIAESIRAQDPADRRAAFDLANVRMRYGTLLVGDATRVAEGLRQLQDAARLNDLLLTQEPESNRYAHLALVLDRRIADAHVLLGQRPAAERLLERARGSAARLLDGPNGPSARAQLALATIKLAALRAEAGDPRAYELATSASAILARQAIGVTELDAGAHASLGRVYLALAKQRTAAARAELLERASANLEKSIAIWHGATLPATLEARRTTELAALIADLAASRGAPDSP